MVPLEVSSFIPGMSRYVSQYGMFSVSRIISYCNNLLGFRRVVQSNNRFSRGNINSIWNQIIIIEGSFYGLELSPMCMECIFKYVLSQSTGKGFLNSL